jgi:SAM-dependent methyltransferase
VSPILDHDTAAARRIEALYRTREVIDQRRHVLGVLAPRAGERILDVGCGTGYLAAEIATQAAPTGAVYGIDVSDAMLALAKSRSARTAIELQRADAASIGAADQIATTTSRPGLQTCTRSHTQATTSSASPAICSWPPSRDVHGAMSTVRSITCEGAGRALRAASMAVAGASVAQDSAPVRRGDVRERLRKRPLMAPRILGVVLALAVHVVGRLVEDLRSVSPRLLAVLACVLDAD